MTSIGVLSIFSVALALAGAEPWMPPLGVIETGPLFSADRPECRDFADFAVQRGGSAPDGLIVAKDGRTQFEFYDPEYGPERPHALWSVSKTVTGALLGIAVRDGRISLDQRLSDFHVAPPVADPAFASIRISDLFYSDTGLLWEEGSRSIDNPLFSMLYGPGRADMGAFVASRPMHPEGAGYRWQYNTGTPTLLMAVLKEVYGDDFAALPWRELFGPLGMTSAVFERDPSGTFVGGAYGFATPRDMLKLGQLYLNDGVWNGRRILPEGWVERTLTVSPGFLSPGTTREQIIDGNDLVYGGLIWLNRHPRPDLPKPFPQSPDDMFMALGRQGQFILGVPSQNMVLVRTGRNGSIDSRIDALVTRALSCFARESVPPAGVDHSWEKGPGLPWRQALSLLRAGAKARELQRSVAKWVCSCHFVSGLSLGSCLKRADIPGASRLLKVTGGPTWVEARMTLLGRVLSGTSGTATVRFDPTRPQFGCTVDQ